MVQGGFQRVGLRAVVEGVGTYVRDVRRVNQETEKVGNAAERAAKKTKSLDDRLRATGARMRETGAQAVFLGTALTGIAAGPAFVAARFNNAFVKIENLVGESREALAGMREDVLSISSDTARGPQELAEALFVIESGGLRGAEAIDTLRASASAAAIGLGQTDTVARVTTQAVLAFREQNLSAAEAVDILVGTARAGNFETSQLAGVFGKVLPIAARLGIRFSDLGAFIATYTRVGGDAADATTALSAVLTTLQRGGSQATKTLKEVGLNLEDLRDIAREEGLAQAIFAILDAVEKGGEGATEKLAEIIPNVRALRGVLATAGVQSEEFLQIQEEVADSLGLTASALERLQEDPLFQFQKAINELKVALIELGGAAAPALTTVTVLLQLLGDAMTSLPGPAQQAIVVMTALAGALLIGGGTVAIFAGSILNLVPAIRTAIVAMRGLSVASLLAGGPLLAIAAALTVATAAFFIFKKVAEEAAEAEKEAAIQTLALKFANDLSVEAIEAKILATEQAIAKTNELREAELEHARNLTDTEVREKGATNARVDHINASEALLSEVNDLKDEVTALKLALEDAEARERGVSQAAAEVAAATDEARKKINEMSKAARTLTSSALAAALALEFLELSALEGFDADRFISNAQSVVGALKAREGVLQGLADVFLGDIGGDVDSSGAKEAAGDFSVAGAAASNFGNEVEAAFARARAAAEANLNQLGDLIKTGLQRAYAASKDAAIGAIEAQRNAARDAFDERIRQLDEQQRRELEAIDARLQAIVGPLQAEIDALDDVSSAEQRADIERRLALEYDARKRAEIERELRDFDRRARIEDIRDQINSAQDAAAAETDAAKEASDARRAQLDEELDAQLSALDAQRDAAEAAYAAQTDAFALESEARRLIVEKEFDDIAALLEAQVPEWRSAGQSFAEALLDGLRTGNVADFVGGLGASVGAGRAAGAGPGNISGNKRDEQLSGLQVQGVTLKEKGAPPFVIEGLREQIRDLGGVPIFHRGGTVPAINGNTSREVIVRALPNEVISRPGAAPTFGEGAFRGMFEGASFAGTPDENAAAFERAFERTLGRALTRGAHVSGAR